MICCICIKIDYRNRISCKSEEYLLEKVIINYTSREKRFAFLKEKNVERLVVNQPSRVSNVGHIYVGTVAKVVPGMNAAFIEIGEGKSGFIHRDKLASFVVNKHKNRDKGNQTISSYVHQGERLLVQIEKDATGTKGPRLTGIIEFAGNHLIYMPNGCYVAVSKKIESHPVREKLRRFGYTIKNEEEGLIFRTSCEGLTDDELIEEFTYLREQYQLLMSKAKNMKKPANLYNKDTFLDELDALLTKMDTAEVIVDDLSLMDNLKKRHMSLDFTLYNGKENIFSAFHVEQEIDKALKRIVWLENGAYLIFDEGEALTVIDVNTGKFEGKQNLEDTVLKTNKLAAIEVARQIRLRDLAGMILIDFIDMKNDAARDQISKQMEKELMKDERRTNLIGFTPLGILQLTRKKTKVSISEALMTKCSVCEGTGRVLSAETIAFRLERELWEYRNGDFEAVLIELSAEVKEFFCGEKDIHKKRMEELLGFQFIFSISSSPAPFYELRQFGNLKDLNRK